MTPQPRAALRAARSAPRRSDSSRPIPSVSSFSRSGRRILARPVRGLRRPRRCGRLGYGPQRLALVTQVAERAVSSGLQQRPQVSVGGVTILRL